MFDQDGIDVHAHDGMPAFYQLTAKTSGTAAGVENAGVAFTHGVDKPGFPIDILALGP
ncbi:hypothetical protein GCM10009604_22650 [Corynebacterium aurimucosum]